MSMFKIRYTNTFERDVYAVQLLDVVVARDVHFWVFTIRTGRWQGNVVWDVTEDEQQTVRWMSAFAGRSVTTPDPKWFPRLIGRVAWAEMMPEVRQWDSADEWGDAVVMPKVVEMHPLEWAFTCTAVRDPFADAETA